MVSAPLCLKNPAGNAKKEGAASAVPSFTSVYVPLMDSALPSSLLGGQIFLNACNRRVLIRAVGSDNHLLAYWKHQRHHPHNALGIHLFVGIFHVNAAFVLAGYLYQHGYRAGFQS